MASPFAALALKTSGVGVNDTQESMDLAKKEKYQAIRFNQLKLEANQALAAGMISQDEYDLWLSGDRSNAVQRFLRINKGRTGSALETLGDVLSVGNYGSVAVASGMTDYAAYGRGVGVDIFGLKIGVNVDAMKKSWQSGRRYQEFASKHGIDVGFGGGFMADVLLDPTTYMTFGVGAGAKALLKGGLKVGAKTIAKEGAEYTISRFGRNIWREAAKDLQEEFAKDVADEAARRYFLEGGERMHMLDRALSGKWQQRITEHMVNNFDRLRGQWLYKTLAQRPGFWKRMNELPANTSLAGKVWAGAGGAVESAVNAAETIAPYFPGTESFLERTVRPALAKLAGTFGASNIIKDSLTRTVDDLFEETASTLTKERGLTNLYGYITSGTVKQRLAANAKLGGFFTKAFNSFDRAWDAPARYVEARRQHVSTVSQKAKEATNRIWANMAHLNDEERTAVSHYVEQRHVWEATGQGNLPGVMPMNDRIEKAIGFFRQEMDSILEEEQKFGLRIERIEDYVSHIYSNPVHQRMMMDTIRRNLIESHYSGNRYAQQRLIATLMDVEDKFGQGTVLTDAMEILSRRKYASIQAMEKTKFLDYVRREFGVGAEMLAGLRESRISSTAIQSFLTRTREGGDHFVMSSVDQMWTEAGGNLTRLGFKESDQEHNLKLLDYLQTPVADRAKHAFNSVANEEAKLHYVLKGEATAVHMPKTVSVSIPKTQGMWHGRPALANAVGGGVTTDSVQKINVSDIIVALNDTSHPLWNVLKDNIQGSMTAVNKYLTTHLDSSLEAFVPDARNLLKNAIETKGNEEVARFTQTYNARRIKLQEKLVNGKITQEVFDGHIDKMTKRHGELVRDIQKQIGEVDKMFDDMNTIEVRKMVGVLPQELIDAAQASRFRMGDITDVSPVTGEQLNTLTERFQELKFTKSQKDDLLKELFGRPELRSAREADILFDFLNQHKKIAGSDNFVEVQLKFPVREGDKYLKDVVTEDIPVGPDVPPSATKIGMSGTAKEQAVLSGNASKNVDVTLATQGAKKTSEYNAARIGYAAQQLVKAEKLTPEIVKDYNDYQVLQRILEQRKKIAATVRSRVVLTAEQKAEKANRSASMVASNLESKIAGAAKLRDEVIAQRDRWLARIAKEAKKRTPNQDQIDAMRVKAESYLPRIQKHEQRITEMNVKLQEANAKIASKNPDINIPRGKKEKPEIAQLKALKQQYDALLGKRLINDVADNAKVVERRAKEHLASMPSDVSVQRGMEAAKAPAKSVTTSGLRDANIGGQAKTKGLAERSVGETPLNNINNPDGTPAIAANLDEAYNPNFDKEYVHSIFLPKSIANDLEDLYRPQFDPAQSAGVRRLMVGWDKTVQYFKTNLMAPVAGFYFRNFQTNAAMAYLKCGLELFKGDYLPVLGYTLGRDGGMFSPEYVEQVGKQIITTQGGRQMTVAELYSEMSRRGILTGAMQDVQLSGMDNGPMAATVGNLRRAANAASGAVFGAMVGTTVDAASGSEDDYNSYIWAVIGALAGGKRLSGTLKKQQGVNNKAAALVQSGFTPFMRAGELTTEIPAKVALFISEFRKTDSLSEAAHAVYTHMNDYANLSSFEKRVMRRAIPFYAWTKLAVESTWHVWNDNPNRMRDVHKLVNNWNESQHGADPEDVPDFLHNKLYLVMGNHVIQSPGTPIEDVADLISTFMPDQIPGTAAGNLGYNSMNQKELFKGVIGRMSFMGGSVVEGLVGKNSYTGADISDTLQGNEWKEAPEWLKAMVGYKETPDGAIVINPNVAWVIGETPWSRMIGIIKNVHDTEDPSNLNYRALARSVLGVSIYKRDERTQKLYINRARLDAMEQLLVNVGQVRRYTSFVDFNKKDNASRRGRRSRGRR